MSNRNLIYILVGVVVVALIGGGVYMTTRPKTTSNAVNTMPSTTPTPTPSTAPLPVDQGEVKAETSFRDLLSSTTSQRCMFEDNTDGDNLKGTVFTDGRRLRGDFIAQNEGKPVGTHMIMKNDMMYTWMDGTQMGVKMSLNELSASGDVQAVDADKKLEFRCYGWTKNDVIFETPTNIEFTDLKAMFPDIPSLPGRSN